MRTLPIGSRNTLDDPIYSQKNPHQTFLLLASILSSVPLLQGHASSAILEKALNHNALLAWGLCLLLGSFAAFVGEFWPGHTWTALKVERLGLAWVGTSAAIYCFVLWRSTQQAGVFQDAVFAFGITAAYALSCFWRVGQITRRLKWIRTLIDEVNAEAEARSEP